MKNTNSKNSNRKMNFSKDGKTFSSTLNNSQLNFREDPSRIKVGDSLEVKINAIGSKQRGIAELASGYTIFIPNPKGSFNLEDKVKVKIVKLDSTKPKFAIGILQEILKKSKKEVPVKLGEILDFSLKSKGPKGSGLVQLPNGYSILIPNIKSSINEKELATWSSSKGALTSNTNLKLEKTEINVKVQITRIKSNYAFAKVFNGLTSQVKGSANTSYKRDILTDSYPNQFLAQTGLQNQLTVGSKLNIFLPSSLKGNSSKINFENLKAKLKSSDYILTKWNGLVFFLKLALGAKWGDKVQIQITKMEKTFAVAKILQLSPLSRAKRKLKVKNQIKKMCESGMHFGEKAIKANANMRKYLWLRKKGQNKNRPFIKKGRHLINLLKTRRCLIQSLRELSKYAVKGRSFLFVGTKKPAAGLIARAALFPKNSFFVNTRWLGGMLTNWKTILKSISKIKPILKEKQKTIQTILAKRQNIKKELVKKVNKLRKRSRLLIQRGQQLIKLVKKEKPKLIERSQILIQKKNVFLQKNQLLLKKYQELTQKKNKLAEKTREFQLTGKQILSQKRTLINKLTLYRKKWKELQLLLLLAQELKQVKSESQKQGKDLLSVSYEEFLNLAANKKLFANLEKQASKESLLVPSPPDFILKKMIGLIRQKADSNRSEQFSTLSAIKHQLAKVATKKAVLEDNLNSKKVLLVSKLLTKFTRFIPFIKTYKEVLFLRIQNIQSLLKNLQATIQIFQFRASLLLNLKKQVFSELVLIKRKLLSEKEIISLLKNKLKKLASEQRLLEFLPKLRYLPTQKNKMAESIQILMKKFIDPKMRYPIDKIYDEKLKFHSKKIAATRKKKWQRLEKYFGGVTKMAKMQKKEISKTVAIIIGQKEEMNAVYECKKLGIKMFHMVDTNSNPRLADYLVPANDDSRNSIKFILGQILTHIRLAQKLRKKLSNQSFSLS
uniref:ribosomal protein S2 n=1 Tax=Parallela transversalis TaxID=163324 RepID=UPI0010C2EA09|nr:ribosomal protein S2 [Parallela transversalis]AYQ22902.1 ribosomal protein S2 [Parallela transversalis]